MASVSGDSTFHFAFGNSAGEVSLPGQPPVEVGRASAAGAAIVWATASQDSLPLGPFSSGAVGALESPLSNLPDLSVIPGASPDRPLPYFQVSDQSPATAGNFRLVVPLVEGYGTTLSTFAKFVDTSDVAESDHRIASGFKFALEGDELAFAAFSLPEPLLRGQSKFQLLVDDMLVDLFVGTEIDFTNYFPGGVQEFALVGINPNERIDSTVPPTFLHGFRFTIDGTAIVQVSALGSPAETAVPEPSSIACALTALLIWLAGRKAGKIRGETGTGPVLGTEGDFDRIGGCPERVEKPGRPKKR